MAISNFFCKKAKNARESRRGSTSPRPSLKHLREKNLTNAAKKDIMVLKRGFEKNKEVSILNQIITVGREFGSGGRELGKRLADHLGIAYYDKEIVEEIAKRTKLDEGYLQQIIEQKASVVHPITVARTLHHTVGSDYLIRQYAAVYAEQANVLYEMAEKSSCVIVGRCADYILKELSPMRLFVYADMASKMARCREKAEEHEHLSDRELKKLIHRVDKNRAGYYRYYTGQIWGDRTNYDMCINTTGLSVKELSEALAHLFSK